MSQLSSKVLLTDVGRPEAVVRPYETVEKALKTKSPADIVNAIEAAGLRGRGGAGFPTGVKWRVVADQDSEEKYILANGAEGEPGCFKDRLLMKELPHQVVAGAILAAYAVGARKGYIYIHHEAEDCMAAIQEALDTATGRGLLGHDILGTGFSLDLQTHVAGIGYVAGEETAAIRFINGDVAKPKAKPPYPTVKGIGGHPTLVNNIETLSNVEPIIRNGVEWYRGFGTTDTPGTLLLSLNGVKRPGVYEVAAGITLREVIFDIGGGPRGSGRVKAVLPGGYSSALLTADDLDVTMEYGVLRSRGSSLGSGSVHVFDDNSCIVEVVRKVLKFFAAETCGQCFACVKGTRDFFDLVQEAERGSVREEWDKDLEVVYMLTGRKTLCGLDKSAAAALRSATKHFPDEFECHLHDHSCAVCASGTAST